MISLSRLFPFLIAGLPVGCAVGPDYHPPKTIAPAQWVSPRWRNRSEKATNPQPATGGLRPQPAEKTTARTE